jgi:FO synthase
LYLRGKSRKGPTLREAILMHAVARLIFNRAISNIQASWTKLGPLWAQRCLSAGANDLGGTLMNESISRAAGASYGQEFDPQQMEELIRAAGREPLQRTTLYQAVDAERQWQARHAAPLSECRSTPISGRLVSFA